MAEGTVTVYTDGACRGNPGPGGWAAIIIFGGSEKLLAGGEESTTNNRMELQAVISALSALNRKCSVSLFSDSKYFVDSMNLGWARGWKLRGWKKKDGKPALNPDLWEKILELDSLHDVTYTWVEGHSGQEFNERCDRIATTFADAFVSGRR